MNKTSRFLKGLLIYALAYCLIAAIGLSVFWQFIDAYELSRPKTAVNAYISSISTEDIRLAAEHILTSLDNNIQTEEEAFALVEESLVSGITAAKSGKKSSVDRAVYMLRSNGQTIGNVAIVPGEEGKFGFTPWQVTDAFLDFSWMLSSEISITVPEQYRVSLNGNFLDENYVTKSDIPYPVLEDFYGDFPMPTLVTYSAGNFLGNLTFEVTDGEGNPVDITTETDLNTFLPCCTHEEESQLKQLTSDFLNAYINYTGSANRMAYANLSRLKQHVVKGGALSERLSAAFGSLVYAQSYGDEIVSTTFHEIYKISEERYLCDLTYILRSVGHNGAVDTEHNYKLIFMQTGNGLKVEAMTNY